MKKHLLFIVAVAFASADDEPADFQPLEAHLTARYEGFWKKTNGAAAPDSLILQGSTLKLHSLPQ